MKFKGLTKLALSGVALAAVAATLGTSTYAWYISNTTAEVTGAQGSTAEANTAGSLYAAGHVDHAKGLWKNKVVLTGGAEANTTSIDYVNTVRLDPVTKATAAATTAYNNANAGVSGFSDVSPTVGSFVDKTGHSVMNVDANKNELTTSSKVLEFDFYLISRGSNVEIKPTLTVTNLTTKTGEGNSAAYAGIQTSYAATNLPSGVTAATGTQFKVDAVHALRMEITNSAVLASKDGTETASANATYAVDTIAGYNSNKTDMVSGGAANLYYNDVVNGVNLYGCDPISQAVTNLAKDVAAPAGTWSNFFLKADTETQLTFKVWLEGTDADCYDSCVSQNFSFAFDFAIV